MWTLSLTCASLPVCLPACLCPPTLLPLGVSFLPYDCGSYKQTPYEKVDRAVYDELLSRMPPAISWSGLREMERKEGEDKCEYELACSANGCEMVDIV